MMLNDTILSAVFASPHMDLELVKHLSPVSRQFLTHARHFHRKLKHLDLELVCSNVAFQDRVLGWMAEYSPNLQSIRNVDGDERSLGMLSSMRSLTSLHFTRFTLSEATLACLHKLPVLESLSIDNLLNGDMFDESSRQINLDHAPKLSLSRLKVKNFGKFDLICQPECLRSLSIGRINLYSVIRAENLPPPVLQRCSNLRSLHVEMSNFQRQRILLLRQEIDALPALVDFSIKGFRSHYWRPMDPVTDQYIRESLTEMVYKDGIKVDAEMLGELSQFPNLRHLEMRVSNLEPDKVFEVLPSLQSLISTAEWINDVTDYRCGGNTVRLVVRWEMRR